MKASAANVPTLDWLQNKIDDKDQKDRAQKQGKFVLEAPYYSKINAGNPPQRQPIMCLGEKIEMGIRELIIYVIGIIVTYFIIKLAVKNAINECLEDTESVIKESIVEGLSEYEYKKQNKE